MLGVATYPKEYIANSQKAVKAQAAAYAKFAATSSDAKAAQKFETIYFNNLTMAMDLYFVHRLRKLTGKDGNALNEVRNVTNSLMENGGVVMEESTFKLDPEASVLGYEVGDKVAITAGDFAKLSKAFYAEVQSKLT
jgi:transcription antitermination factor NusG